MIRVAVQAGQGLQIAGVGQRIEVDDFDAARDGLENEVTANESGAAGDKPCGHYLFSCSTVRTGARGAPDTARQDTCRPFAADIRT